jgi:PIN domain nuclease of toxin-antitoxin system
LRFLLDTHIWIWFLQNSEQLAPRTLQQLADPANELWLSPISTWEALMLQRKGRIRLPADLSEWLSKSTAGIFEAPLTHEITLASQRLTIHADPADRFLVATAQVLNLILVTSDEKLLGISTIKTLANR